MDCNRQQQEREAKEEGSSSTASDQLLGLFAPPPQTGGNDDSLMEQQQSKEDPTSSLHYHGSSTVDSSNKPASVAAAPATSTIAPFSRGLTAPEQGTTESLTNLFAPPPAATQNDESKALLGESSQNLDQYDSLNGSEQQQHTSALQDMPTERKRRSSSATEAADAFFQALRQYDNKSAPPAVLFPDDQQQPTSQLQQFVQNQLLQPTTFAGALMFLLYHVVFCLANASAIIRPNSPDAPILGVMAKLSTVGILFSGPFYIHRLGPDIPALYPSIDLFLAPFLAQAAAIVDESLTRQYADGDEGSTYSDELFFGSFAVLTSIGMFLAGIFLLLAASFKLANLGTYLPYSVLCGFFSAVGVLLWALAFSVDTSGKTWKMVFFSGDAQLIGGSILHHLPSLIVGILMNRLGPKNPFYVILLIVATQFCFYIVMWITGTSLEDAQRAKWFWSYDELVYKSSDEVSNLGLESWTLPPAPFGSFGATLAGNVNWTAVHEGLGNMAALAFLYLLRSSIHASAMKKNIGNLVRRIPADKTQKKDEDLAGFDLNATIPSANKGQVSSMASQMVESVRQSVILVNMSLADKETLITIDAGGDSDLPSESKHLLKEKVAQEPVYTEIRAKPSQKSLEEIFVEYGYALLVVAGFGGFGCCPTVATSNTMYAIGADKAAPQLGSILLLVIFYFTDFELVRYIPKTAFSSLLVLGAVDTLVVWFWNAFWKTQDIAEWLVVPIIVLFSLFVGFLNAVFLGIALSLFVFVASFFQVGVVKFNATGLEIRSRIERSMAQSVFLDNNGDYVQVLVLQNYLFFGNASSILHYISTMFEDVDEAQSMRLDFSLPPKPKVLVVDLSLITGMDTSTADIFADIKEHCKNNDCKLFLCGLSPRMKQGLALGGVKPERGPRNKSTIRIFSDLDTALGKAEDILIQTEMANEAVDHRQMSPKENGFRYALKQINELHGQEFAHGLLDLQPFTVPLELEPGQCLFESDGGVVPDGQRGLFFIESGLLKITRDSSQSMTTTRTRSGQSLKGAGNNYTLKNQHARTGTVARRASIAKGALHGGAGAGHQHLRLARIGPGWVCGTLENASGLRPSGVTIAVTRCQLHHLPFHKLQEIETDNPVLILRLYKMLSHLMAQREEIKIEQLTTLHNIMSSPAHSKPISRQALRAMS